MALARTAKGLLGVTAGCTGVVGLVCILDEEKRGLTGGVKRTAVAVYQAGAAAYDYKTSLRDFEKGTKAYNEKKEEAHGRSAQRFLKVCVNYGGLYTKFGQHVSSMNHIMPKQYTETLKVLQDENPSVSLEEVEKAVQRELGGSIDEFFHEFDHVAMAAASLAQVHRAVTKAGKEVAVKLQYPGLEQQVQIDMMTMELLAKALGIIFPDYEYTWLFPEFKESIALELDFVQEAANSERVALMFRDDEDVHVPGVVWELTTRRLLTMEYIHGIKISRVDEIAKQGMDPKKVAGLVSKLFGSMIFYHGMVHCDPHPGNLFVRPHPSESADKLESAKNVRPQVVLLDHGMYRRLDPAFRHTHCRLWKAFITHDDALGQQSAVDLGQGPEMYDALSLIFTWRPSNSSARIGQRITEAERLRLKEKYETILSAERVNAFLESLPRDLLFVMRTGDMVRGLNKELGGTTQQRLSAFGEAAIHGLALKNPPELLMQQEEQGTKEEQKGQGQGQEGQRAAVDGTPPPPLLSATDSFTKEAAFREYLVANGVDGPSLLRLSNPQAGVNRLVSSEVTPRAQSHPDWWTMLHFRARMKIFDYILAAVWWWRGDKPFTTRSVG